MTLTSTDIVIEHRRSFGTQSC